MSEELLRRSILINIAELNVQLLVSYWLLVLIGFGLWIRLVLMNFKALGFLGFIIATPAFGFVWAMIMIVALMFIASLLQIPMVEVWKVWSWLS